MHFNNTVLHCYCNVVPGIALVLIFLKFCSFITIHGKVIVGFVYLLTTWRQSTKYSGGFTFIFPLGLFHFDRLIREPINQVTIAFLVLLGGYTEEFTDKQHEDCWCIAMIHLKYIIYRIRVKKGVG